jgi:glycosyltransferase involved in cell wall biosynthesis
MAEQECRYVLVTPVRDEVVTIGRTIAAVTRQTVQPREWVIVSDGSTDGTNEVVEQAIRKHRWMHLLALPERPSRDFSAVVVNTEAGVRALTCDEYDYIGLLDGDVEFQADYFETLIARFEANPRLGLAGGVVVDPGKPKSQLPRNRMDVPGAVQFFRRSCFDGLGGLLPIPEGGWDVITCAVARMNGSETELVTELIVDHLKPRNITQGGPVGRMWQLGVRDYAVGYSGLFELAKCLGRISETPLFVASLARWCGFCAAAIRRRPRVVPPHVVEFVRKEQRGRVWAALRSLGRENRTRRGEGAPTERPREDG